MTPKADLYTAIRSLKEGGMARLCTPKTMIKARGYADRVSDITFADGEITAQVEGRMPQPYKVRIWYERGVAAACTCPVGSGFCKHAMATMLYVSRMGAGEVKASIEARHGFRGYIESLGKEELVEILYWLAESNKAVKDALELRAAGSKGYGGAASTYIRQIDSAVRGFVDYNAMRGFMNRLDDIKGSIEKFADASPAPAAAIMEHFISKCRRHYEETDDSDGDYGTFIDELYKLHAKALSRFDFDREKASAWIMDLLEDDYSLGHNALECYKSVLRGGAYEPLEKALLSKREESAAAGRDSEGSPYKHFLSELHAVAGRGRKKAMR